MLAIERKQIIVSLLREQKKVYVADLSRRLQVAEETIRRDLRDIEKKGIAMRSYGGAVLKEGSGNMPFLERETRNFDLKRRIAGVVLPLIHDGMMLMVDASTTSKMVIEAVDSRTRLTIITNSYKLINEMAGSGNLNFIGTGGICLTHYHAFAGSDAINTLSRYNADLAILGSNSVCMNHGFMESDPLESDLKAAMAAHARQTVISIDHTKFDQTGRINTLSFADADFLATDQVPDARWLKFLKDCKIEVLYPD